MREIKTILARGTPLFFFLFLSQYILVDIFTFSNSSFCFFGLFEGADLFLLNQLLKYFLAFLCFILVVSFSGIVFLRNEKFGWLAAPTLIILTTIFNINIFQLCPDSIPPFIFFNTILSLVFILAYNLFFQKMGFKYFSVLGLSFHLIIFTLIPIFSPKVGFSLSATTRKITIKHVLKKQLSGNRILLKTNFENIIGLSYKLKEDKIELIDIGFGTQVVLFGSNKDINNFKFQYTQWN